METNFAEGDELIIVDDCSADGTVSVIRELKNKYPAIKIITHAYNKGGGAARNTAIENASNDLLFCLDSDNVLEENSIPVLKKLLLDTGADISSFEEMRYFNTQDKTETKYTWRFLPVTTLSDFMADNKNPGSSGNYLFTKDSWLSAKRYPEFAGALDTWGFCFKQLAAGCKLVSAPGSYYFHRYGTASYYIRDMNARNMSIAALQIVLSSHHLIDPEDLDYMMSEKHRLNWFENLDTRPIRIAGHETGNRATNINAVSHSKKAGLIKRIYRKLKNKFAAL